MPVSSGDGPNGTRPAGLTRWGLAFPLSCLILVGDVEPEVGYACSGDVHIAYTVTGGGPLDLVLVEGYSPTSGSCGSSRRIDVG